MKELNLGDEFKLQDVKTNRITAQQLDELKTLAGSFEALFSRNAMKYREWNLREKELEEEDYRQYILDEYTFLKRPVVIVDEKILIGNSRKTEEALSTELGYKS